MVTVCVVGLDRSPAATLTAPNIKPSAQTPTDARRLREPTCRWRFVSETAVCMSVTRMVWHVSASRSQVAAPVLR
jgi:hypothetical protein